MADAAASTALQGIGSLATAPGRSSAGAPTPTPTASAEPRPTPAAKASPAFLSLEVPGARRFAAGAAAAGPGARAGSAPSAGSRKRKRSLLDEGARRDGDDDHDDGDEDSQSQTGKRHSTGPPWQMCSAYSPVPALALHQEISEYSKYVSPTAAEARMRRELVGRLARVAKELWPKVEVLVFGSVQTGFFLPSSDVDVVLIGKWQHLPLHTLARALKSRGISKSMRVIAKARIPIIKYKDAKCDIEVDVSFNVRDGPRNGARVRAMVEEMKPLRPLVLVIKQFLAQRNLNEVFTGGLGSYGILLMVYSFLQLHPRKLRGQDINLGVLLMEFFEHYGINFNYHTTGISVRDGGSYFNKYERGWSDYNRPDLLSIENPQSPADDVTRNSYNMLQVRQCFEHAYHMLASRMHEPDPKGKRESILSRIIRLPGQVVEARARIERGWAASVLREDEDWKSAAAACPEMPGLEHGVL